MITGSSLKRKRFKVKIGGKRHKTDSVRIDSDDNTAVIITIQDISYSDIKSPVTVSYRDPRGDQNKGVLEDLYGNDIASFKNLNIDI